MTVKFKDYYEVLGVDRNASQEDIQRAFRRLARKYHPDVNKAPEASDKFKEINEAYEVLRDPEKRSKYDRLGENWKSGEDFTPPPGWDQNVHFEFGGGGADAFSDFFKTVFGGGFGGAGGDFHSFDDLFESARGGGGRRAQYAAQGQDQEAEIEVSLEEAHNGTKKRIDLMDPDAGAASRKSLDVRIPAGVTDGSKIRLGGQGAPGARGGQAGDLYLRVRLRPDPRFELSGHNLKKTVRVNAWDAALGTTVPVDTLEGSVSLKVPAGTQSGQTLRLRGKGMRKRSGGNGDLLVIIQITVPKHLTARQRELFEELRKESS